MLLDIFAALRGISGADRDFRFGGPTLYLPTDELMRHWNPSHQRQQPWPSPRIVISKRSGSDLIFADTE